MLSDDPSDDPLLNDAFDFSRYPAFKAKTAKLSNKPDELRSRARGCITLLAYSSCGSPSRPPRWRNVSEPQLISSTNHMRESWFTSFASTRTVSGIVHLSSDGDIPQTIQHTRSATITCEAPGGRSWCGVDNEQPPKPTSALCEDSRGVSGPAELSEYKDEDNSFYSMDSAHQDVHPLLLSMPMIPQIKLERKATIRKSDPRPSSDDVQDRSFLSPRIPDLRTPARLSSRRYGRILGRANPLAVISDGRRSGMELGYMRSVSEPMLSAAYSSDDMQESLLKKGTDDSPHSDVLLSMIDEAGPSPGSYGDHLESGIDKLLRQKQAPYEDSKRGHQRSPLSHSISFSSIVHAVADGYASLDHLLRSWPKPRLECATKSEPSGHVPNAHDVTSRWAPKQGQVVIKVFVPSTDDIWMFRVPQNIDLSDFTSRVVRKLGFPVAFSGSLWDEPKYYFGTDQRFKLWVEGRVRFGRNLPIVAHVLAPTPLMRLNADEDGCEVWCYT